MQQMSFFSEDIPAPAPKIVNFSKVHKRDYSFNFDETIKKIKDIQKSTAKDFNKIIEIGKLLNRTRINKPTIQKSDITKDGIFDLYLVFWEYVEKYTNLPIQNSFEYIRAYEINTLLTSQKFPLLPSVISHIRELERYSDNQIIEIWEYLNLNYSKVTVACIKESINNLRKNNQLELITNINTHASYFEYLSELYKRQYFDLKIMNQSNASLQEFNDLKDKYNSLVRDFNYQKSISSKKDSELSSFKSKILFLEMELNLLRSKSYDYNDNDLIYLQVLGLNSDSTKNDIKTAYRKLSNIYHPDKNINESPERKVIFENNFKLIQNAYNYLKESFLI